MESMERVKVDLELFVLCRLCLEEKGVYRINQVVQHQIKYCFDIDVDISVSDGLPQLICSQCETILSDFFTKKRIFVGRQNALKAKQQVRKELEGELRRSPPQETVSSSQQNDNEVAIARPISRAKKRKSRIISSSSSSTAASLPPSRETTRSPPPSLRSDTSSVHKKPKEKPGPKKRPESWETNYMKWYACKLCSKNIKFGGGIGNHVKTHANILTKYRNIIGNACEVPLIKIDGMPNPTGDKSTVAINRDRILGHTEKEHVFVIYTPKESESNVVENQEAEKGKTPYFESDDEEVQNGKASYFESDNDEDDILNTSKHTKRRRLLSRSSTDTVVLNDEDKNITSHVAKQEKNAPPEKQVIEDIVTINLDDSSNDSTQSSNVKNDDTNSITPKDEEAVRNLIRVCQSKYITKRQEMLEAEMKQAANKGQLKRKLLSMGRKVINKQPVSCTGVLRFMESRNLDIKWIPTAAGNKENVVRIMPRTKTKLELASDNSGWKKKPEVANKEYVLIVPKQGPSKTECRVSLTSLPPKDSGPAEMSVGNYLSDLNIAQNSNAVVNQPVARSPETDLFKDLDSETKLLNAYPVANPKQLPKKSNNTDNKLQPATLEKVVENAIADRSQQQSLYIDLEDDEPLINMDMPMPIIMSTTSLAVSPGKIKTERNDNDNNIETANSETANEAEKSSSEIENHTDKIEKPTNQVEKTANEVDKPAHEVEKPAPRIKVKPVSELMSQSVLNSYQQSNAQGNMWHGNGNAAPAIPAPNGLGLLITQVTSGGVPVASSQLVPPAPAPAAPAPPSTASNSRSYIILDTVEMPNTKTESPVQYLRNLLYFHNITLLNSNEPLPPNAVCLIKFKLQFSRDSANPPVTLGLSVHCAGNKFSLGVTNPKQERLDLNTLGATWQWEILKVYIVRQEVVTKMLQNAQKVSQEMYNVTKTFTTLLKSINYKKGDKVC